MRSKYPRTVHLPWSPGFSSDDIHLDSTQNFHGKEVIITEKMDGENTTMYSDYIHARSIDGRHHPSRDWVKKLQAQLAPDLPKDWRFCGENMYAEHSIAYQNLESYFYLFAIFDAENTCLSWDEISEWAELLGVPTPKLLYRGLWNEDLVRAIQIQDKLCEGYVVRLAQAFSFSDFARSTAKWVRKGHVQTDTHWMHTSIRKNKLKEV